MKKKSRKPLVLRGARQVGKSTLVRNYARDKGLHLLEVNLERHRELNEIFATFEIKQIKRNLEAIIGERIRENSLLFLDEIQATPFGLAALRYFYEEVPSLPVIAAGSLLEFALADHNFSMPVGRIQYMHLSPMTFSEFLKAVDPYSFDFIQELELREDIPLEMHNRLLSRQREYMIVGGMPEAVAAFADNQSFDDVRSIQNSIVNTYIDDFSKYAKQSDLTDLQIIFRKIPAVIGEKTKYVHLLPDEKSERVKSVLNLLTKAQIIRRVFASDCSGVPLDAGRREKIFKLYFLDVGLVARILGQDFVDIEMLDNIRLVNEGAWAEQFVAQHLNLDSTFETNENIHYWLNEKRGANAEVDFVLSCGNTIVPLEVKSGKSGSLKSLHYFAARKKLSYAIRFDMNTPSIMEVETSINLSKGLSPVKYKLISLPLYALEKLPEIMDGIRRGDID